MGGESNRVTGVETGGGGGQYISVNCDEALQHKVKIVVIGAQAVGKTSIVEQFVHNRFNDHYIPSLIKETHYPSLIINDRLYNLKIVDCPVISYFPASSIAEWTDFRGYGLRSATGYILVYDICREDSFNYIKCIREQMCESRDMHDVPVLVAANKCDLCHFGPAADERAGRQRRDVANLVKRNWKAAYVECSARYNWHILHIFKELMKLVDHRTPAYQMRMHEALGGDRCVIL